MKKQKSKEVEPLSFDLAQDRRSVQVVLQNPER
jgi:hypothetical protein